MRFRRRALLAAPVLLSAASVDAQDSFPNRPVTIVVPAAPGGSTDALARLVARGMAPALGQPVVVENVGGAGGTIGTRRVAQAAADGHTLTIGNNGTLAANVSLYPQLGFDPREFEPVGIVARVPMVLAVGPRAEPRSIAAFLAMLRERGDRVTFGTPGVGSTGHLAPAYLLQILGAQATLVSYRGAGPAMSDLAAGTVDAVIDQTVTLIPAHRGGTAVALAVTGPARLPQLPDVPTFAEAGVPRFDMVIWNAIAAPRGTPRAATARLAAALDAALNDAELRRRYAELAVPVPAADDRGPETLRRLIAAEVETWAQVIRTAGIRAE